MQFLLNSSLNIFFLTNCPHYITYSHSIFSLISFFKNILPFLLHKMLYINIGKYIFEEIFFMENNDADFNQSFV